MTDVPYKSTILNFPFSFLFLFCQTNTTVNLIILLVGTFNKLKECFYSFNIVQKPNSKQKEDPDLPTLFLSACYAIITIFLASANQLPIDKRQSIQGSVPNRLVFCILNWCCKACILKCKCCRCNLSVMSACIIYSMYIRHIC